MSSLSPPDVSAVIVSYNTRDLLRRCLESVLGPPHGDQTPAPWHEPARARVEVFVVDNASNDGSTDMVRGEFPQARLLASAENLGFARGNNLALRQARGRHLLLLNPDTEVKGDALTTLVRFLDEHPRAAVAGPRLVYGDGALQHSAFRFPTLWQTYFDFFPHPARLLGSTLNGRHPHGAYAGLPFKTDFVLGACLLVRREAVLDERSPDSGTREVDSPLAGEGPWQARGSASGGSWLSTGQSVPAPVGLLDEGYFMYCEEMDLCWRLKAVGWDVWCVPQASVIHYEAQSSQQTRWRSYVVKWQSRYRFFAAHYPPWWQAANRLLVRLGTWAEARRARQDCERRVITESELEERFTAFRQAAAL